VTADGPERLNISTDDGRMLECLVSGPEDGAVLVFHAGTSNGLVPLPSGLDPSRIGVRTVLYARPGYGRSTPQPGRRVADAATDTATILDALGIERFLNVGWSGGGPHALACNALLADRCQATAVIAGPAPYTEAEPSSQVRSWYETDEDNQLALAGDIDGFRQACEAFVTQFSNAQGDTISANTPSAADRRFLSEGYAEWFASLLREAGISGSHGVVDDCLASLHHWGFPLTQTRKVVIWHGSEDQNVPAFHGVWLRDHLPEADLQALENEGHLSIIGHLTEIINALIARGSS
jgi:pimeloyl-ACP methyl ester carboxylesterase